MHNLEHGYTILWYDQAAVRRRWTSCARSPTQANKLDASKDKFIVVAVGPSLGAFPAGKKFALSHWSADARAATRRPSPSRPATASCAATSPASRRRLRQEVPRTSATPEPGAA